MTTYLVTGGGGFIGCHLVQELASNGHQVRILDDFSTGRRTNLSCINGEVELFEGSVCDPEIVAKAMTGVDCCFHHAAIPSVARSLHDPILSNRVNVEGTLRVLTCARDASVRRVICASSSSVYGNRMVLGPASESLPRSPLSPYAASKAAAEMYGEVFASVYGMDVVWLRYFNVFGPFQNPDSAYAAVIPIFVKRILQGRRPIIHGDGTQSRDFSYVANVVLANMLACRAPGRLSGIYNIACGATTSINELLFQLNVLLGTSVEPEYTPSRPGDIQRSFADISRARETFGYKPVVPVEEGLAKTVAWYREAQQAA